MSTWASRLSTGSNQTTPIMAPAESPASPPPPLSMGGDNNSLDGSATTATAAAAVVNAWTSSLSPLSGSPTMRTPVTATGTGSGGGLMKSSGVWKSAAQLRQEAQQQQEAEAAVLREEFRQIAAAYNADPSHAPALRLPLDAWELATCFLSYADVVQLAHACRPLWRFLMRRESIWEQQLRFFHEDVLDMRGGSLLMTGFVIPQKQPINNINTNTIANDAAVFNAGASSISSTITAATASSPWPQPSSQAGDQSVTATATASAPTNAMPASHRFWLEKRLYVLDAHREWHFNELASLEDRDTGVFTVALHLGHETRKSSAAAPLSRPIVGSSLSLVVLPMPPTPPLTPSPGGGIGGMSPSATPPMMPRTASPGSGPSADPLAWGLPGLPPLPPSSTTTTGGGSPAPQQQQQQQQPRTPAVGAPFVGPHGGALPLRILRPVRPGEMLSPVLKTGPRGRRHGGGGGTGGVYSDGYHEEDDDDGCYAYQDPASLSAAGAFGNGPHPGNNSTSSNNSYVNSSSNVATRPFFASDHPITAEDEEAAIAYVIALSEAEANGLPPPPPPMYRRSQSQQQRKYKSINYVASSSSSRGGGGSQHPAYENNNRHQQEQQQQPCLRPSELMTILEAINTGATGQSRIPVRDVTAKQPPLFMTALQETLKGAKRRRLHLGNHHRAVLNNGQTRRNRGGRLRAPQQQQHEQQQDRQALNPFANTGNVTPSPPPPDLSAAAADGVVAVDPAGPFQSHVDPATTPPRSGVSAVGGGGNNTPAVAAAAATIASAPPPAPLPPPPINRMLRDFTGQLVEITKREAYAVSTQLMGLPDIVDDFIIFHHYGGNGTDNSNAMSTSAAGGDGGSGMNSLLVATDAAYPNTNANTNVPAARHSFPRTRFFLMPELAAHGTVGLVIVDVVRLLVAVEKDRSLRGDNDDDSNSDWALDELRPAASAGGSVGQGGAGRVGVRPGQGYNAQYYQRDEMRPL